RNIHSGILPPLAATRPIRSMIFPQIPTTMKKLDRKMHTTGTRATALRPSTTSNFVRPFSFYCALTLICVWTARAQLDPEPRQLLHVGVNQPLHDDGPQAHYLFYYWNMPDVPSTNQVLRLVLAPTYVDGELGFKGLLGQNTDLGVSVFGGGYAYDYDE